MVPRNSALKAPRQRPGCDCSGGQLAGTVGIPWDWFARDQALEEGPFGQAHQRPTGRTPLTLAAGRSYSDAASW